MKTYITYTNPAVLEHLRAIGAVTGDVHITGNLTAEEAAGNAVWGDVAVSIANVSASVIHLPHTEADTVESLKGVEPVTYVAAPESDSAVATDVAPLNIPRWHQRDN